MTGGSLKRSGWAQSGSCSATRTAVCLRRSMISATAAYDDAVAVLEDAAQIAAYRLAQDVAIETILAALAATRDGLGNPPAIP